MVLSILFFLSCMVLFFVSVFQYSFLTNITMLLTLSFILIKLSWPSSVYSRHLSSCSCLSNPSKYFISQIIFSIHTVIFTRHRDAVIQVSVMSPSLKNIKFGPFFWYSLSMKQESKIHLTSLLTCSLPPPWGGGMYMSSSKKMKFKIQRAM